MRDTSSSFASSSRYLGDLAQDELEELVEIERRAEGEADLAQRVRDARLPRERCFELADSCALRHGPGPQRHASMLHGGPPFRLQAAAPFC
jgi:hypothetical protein